MKRTLLTALVICASVCVTSAQTQKTTASSPVTVENKEADQKAMQAKKAQEWNDLLKTELKLTDEQVTKITDLNKAFGERRQAIHNNATLTDEVKAEKKLALKKAWDTQFLNILTPEQQVRYKELMESKK